MFDEVLMVNREDDACVAEIALYIYLKCNINLESMLLVDRSTGRILDDTVSADTTDVEIIPETKTSLISQARLYLTDLAADAVPLVEQFYDANTMATMDDLIDHLSLSLSIARFWATELLHFLPDRMKTFLKMKIPSITNAIHYAHEEKTQ
jgi:hypothetical protein